MITDLADAVNIIVDDNENDICKIASLLIINACLLHKRLQSVSIWADQLVHMMDVSGAE